MRWLADKAKPAGGTWRCLHQTRAAQDRYEARNPTRHRDRYHRFKDAGLCSQCGKDVPITESRCFTCLGILDEANLTRTR